MKETFYLQKDNTYSKRIPESEWVYNVGYFEEGKFIQTRYRAGTLKQIKKLFSKVNFIIIGETKNGRWRDK